MKTVELIKNQPVAKFFYKGQSHTHPVRRTVMLTEASAKYIIGYEVREGFETRDLKDAPIKTYNRKRIAKIGQIDRRRVMRVKAAKNELNNTTLRRRTLIDVLKEGI